MLVTTIFTASNADFFPFLALPLELRNVVYTEYAVDDPLTYILRGEPRHDAISKCGNEQDEPKTTHIAYATRHLPPLSLVCKEVHAEFEEEVQRLYRKDGRTMLLRLVTPQIFGLPGCIST